MWWNYGIQWTGSMDAGLSQVYSDFNGRELRFTTNNNWPFFKIREFADGTVWPVSGIDFSVVAELSNTLNFT